MAIEAIRAGGIVRAEHVQCLPHCCLILVVRRYYQLSISDLCSLIGSLPSRVDLFLYPHVRYLGSHEALLESESAEVLCVAN